MIVLRWRCVCIGGHVSRLVDDVVPLSDGASPGQEYILCTSVSGGFFPLGVYFQAMYVACCIV